MPELPEVETVCRGLNKTTSALTIKSAKVLLPRTLAYPDSVASFEQGITTKKIIQWHRRGKYLLAQLSEGWLGVHLRMTGQLLWINQDSELQKHTRVRLFFDGGKELRFVDTRTFGKFWWLENDNPPETVVTGLQKLGVEPFSPQFTVEYFQEKLSKSRRNIKTLLLDQTVVAGIGNIYADEALFKSGIMPNTISCNLTSPQIEKLRIAIIEVLNDSIKAGGTSFSDFLHITGVNGNYGGKAWVYGRKGQPCRVCNTPIDKMKLSGRSTHFCPNCQS
ncbi:DNA-formamidopyrimidine glycosylase [Cyanobacterium stanieri LEGE 03274]|uniref:Formamidopyrimidine-DNA glycosylase n=1 Tax=Cyanobacterium stanieri LEGE 03274 TaxID=1828756 RepID=A0ABR9V676_9CHRO|nr:DNA-formamidopyrimidine glycosylase [Cyanobacterium stanieri]MBE9223392.1 DNA-formamidopyrimidine glycosylase [Cyanobacterium stanieri LEGE 03274]